MFVSKITYEDSCDGKEGLSDIEVHAQYFNAEGKQNQSHANGNRIDNIVAEIFPTVISLCLENEKLMADIGIGDIEDRRQHDQNHVLNLIGKEEVANGQRRISERCVPYACDQKSNRRRIVRPEKRRANQN